MAPSGSGSGSGSSTHRSHLFTPIEEGNESEESKDPERHRLNSTEQPATPKPGADRSVSCNNCRPTTTREKTSVVVVPLTIPTPNSGLIKSILLGLSRRSPKPATESSSETAALSHKLLQATRRRDEALLEASTLKYSIAELEKKLNRLELYCHSLKSGLDICGFTHNQAIQPPHNHDLIIKSFLVSVSEARGSIRILSRALTSQVKLMGVKVLDRLSAILRSYDFKLSSSNMNNPRSTLHLYLEALLSAAFFQDFEMPGFARGSPHRVLNPIYRSQSNYSAFNDLKHLAWEEVLSKGTKHFSEEFSRFCDRKMSEIVAMLGWNRPWPEQLLQAFFGASKAVWLVHLLANSVHPSLTIFRVGKGVGFDPVYMEDTGGDKTKKLAPTMVRIMVAPGFYVYENVVKCKVVCRYYNTSSNSSAFSSATANGDDKRIVPSPP